MCSIDYGFRKEGNDLKHIIFYSGGLCSYATADRVIKKYGKENVILFFIDTKKEDEDLYRFLDETVKDFDCEFINIADGRNVWEVMEDENFLGNSRDENFLGNSRVASCSKKLKQKISKKYIKKYFKPEDCILYLGLDWTEIHRIESPKRNWKPYNVEFPMTEEPYLSKKDMIKLVESKGIKIPRLYNMGFSHNNCGGFCVRAGQGHFINLLEKMPDRYKYHEDKE